MAFWKPKIWLRPSSIMATAVLCALSLGSPAWGDDAPRWTFETTAGYDAGLGQGLSWVTYGNADATGTYYSSTRHSVGTSGFHAELRVGYDWDDHWGVTLAPSLLIGTPTLGSGYGYYTDGTIASRWKQEFNFGSIRLTPSIRYWFSKGSTLNVYGLLGPMLVVPSPINETSQVDSLVSSNRYFYGLGVGIQTEIGGEFLLGKTWGLHFAVAFDKISLPRVSISSQSTSGSETTVNYTDNPSTDDNDQTAADVAKSTSTSKYYTYPTYYDDFSDVSFKAGFIWHF
jgi:hypothetical protein